MCNILKKTKQIYWKHTKNGTTDLHWNCAVCVQLLKCTLRGFLISNRIDRFLMDNRTTFKAVILE